MDGFGLPASLAVNGKSSPRAVYLKIKTMQRKSPKRKTLNICHVNVRSLSASTRLTSLEILTCNHNVDILCLSETWLSSKKSNKEILIPGFQPPFRRDRLDSLGGGVAIYVKDCLAASLCHPNPSLQTSIECLGINISLSRRTKLAILVAYRPPRACADAFCSELDNIVDLINNSYKPSTTCIVGDFNAKVQDWFSSQQTDAPGRQLLNFALSQDLTQVISEPTYAVDSTSASPSLLDLMFTNKPEQVLSSSVLPPLSDHCPTLMHLQLSGSPSPKPTAHLTFDYERTNFQALAAALQEVDWSPVMASTDINDAVSLWSSLFVAEIRKFVPVRKICLRGKKPWYSPLLHKVARIRDRLFRKSRGCPLNSPEVARYRRVRNWYVCELRRAERSFYQSLSASFCRTSKSSSSHSWWCKLKAAVKWSSKEHIPPLSLDGALCLSAREKAEAINKVFSEQCSYNASPSSVPISPQSALSTTASFTFSPIPKEDVLNALRNLNPWKACGLDLIPNRLLKECATPISSSLCHLFNLSISTGVFPSQWKAARIQPIYKQKGDRSKPMNYRPIALLPAASKVFEHLMKKQLLSFCLKEKLIPDCQFGFLPGRSTIWQLLSILDDWHTALDSGHSIHALFLDVAKAFDRVNHSLLVEKCRSIGVSDSSLAWIESYLHDRSITTAVDGELSSTRPTSSGVPQGSVLGPLFFVIYFSSLPTAVNTSTTAMFADDTLLYNSNCSQPRFTTSSTCCTLQDDTDNVHKWANNMHTTFNPAKSASMVISRRRPNSGPAPQLLLDKTPVPIVETTRHLGITLSSSLRWSPHIANILKSVSWKVCLLKRLAYRARLSLPVFSLLYTTLLRPCLEYAGCVWDNCSAADSAALERIQITLARAILSVHLGPSCTSSLSKSQLLLLVRWPTLAWRRRRQKIIHFWRLKNGLGPPSLSEKLSASVSQRCNYSLRSSHSSQVPLCSSSARLTSFLPSSCILWNTLPPTVVSTTSVSSFCKLLDAHYSSDTYSFGLPK